MDLKIWLVSIKWSKNCDFWFFRQNFEIPIFDIKLHEFNGRLPSTTSVVKFVFLLVPGHLEVFQVGQYLSRLSGLHRKVLWLDHRPSNTSAPKWRGSLCPQREVNQCVFLLLASKHARFIVIYANLLAIVDWIVTKCEFGSAHCLMLHFAEQSWHQGILSGIVFAFLHF